MNNRIANTEPIFNINVQPETFSKSSVDTITGVIYVNANGFTFPGEGWDDIVVEIVRWWVAGVIHMVETGADEFVCQFMDGDFQYSIQAHEGGLWCVRFVRGHMEFHPETAQVLHEKTYKPQTVIDALLRAAEVCIEACRERGWKTYHTEQITRDYARLSEQRRGLAPVAV